MEESSALEVYLASPSRLRSRDFANDIALLYVSHRSFLALRAYYAYDYINAINLGHLSIHYGSSVTSAITSLAGNVPQAQKAKTE